MPDPTLAVQKAIRSRLIGTAAVTSLVPATSVLDRNQRPAPDPSIILGEDQMVDPGITISRSVQRVVSTLHIWKKEPSLEGVKSIGGAVRDSLKAKIAITDFQCCDIRITAARYMRDPDGETSHGVMTVETLVREVAP